MKNRKTILKHVSFYIISFIIVAGALIGISYGIGTNYASSDAYKINDTFKNYYRLEIEIDWNDEEEDIVYVANYFDERLTDLGYEYAYVEIIGTDSLAFVFPINSIYNLDEDAFDYSNQYALQYELAQVTFSLLNQSYIEFRSINGEQLFVYDGQTVNFVPPNTSTESQSVIDDYSYNVPLVEYAELEYMNGSPVIKIYPYDYAANAFQDANEFYFEWSKDMSAVSEGYTQFVVWFGYDFYEKMVQELDPEGYAAAEDNLYTYVFTDSTGVTYNEPRETAEPFYVNTQTVTRLHSEYVDYYYIIGDFTVDEAESIVNRINFSNKNYDITITSSELVFNENTFDSISWMYWFFLAVVVLIAFFMMYWFGLLGAIYNVIAIFFAFIMLIVISLCSIPLSITAIIAGIIVYSYYIISGFYVLNRFKWNIDNNNTSWQKLISNTKDITKIIFIPSFVLLLVFGISSFIFTISIQLFLSLLYFGILITLIFIYLLLIPSLFITDWFLNFSWEKPNKKWNFYTGHTSSGLNNNKFNIKVDQMINDKSNLKTVKIISFLFIFITILFVGIGGVIYATSGNFINQTWTYNGYYRYDVYRTETINYQFGYGPLDSEGNADISENDIYGQKYQLEHLNEEKNEIIEVFENNGIEVIDYQIIRFDNYEFSNTDLVSPDENYNNLQVTFDFTYGVSIYSKDLITLEQFNSINNELATIGVTVEEDAYIYHEGSNDPYMYNYSISINSGSISNIDGTIYIEEITVYSGEHNLTSNMWAMLFIFVVLMFITLILMGFKGSIPITIAMLFEFVFMIGIGVILFFPFSAAVFLAIMTVMFISLLSKVIWFYTRKDSDIRTKNVSRWLVLQIISLAIFACFLTAIVVFGFSAGAVVLLVYSFGMAAVNITNIYFMPYMTEFIEIKRLQRKIKKQNKDIVQSKHKKVVSEEYIKDINFKDYLEEYETLKGEKNNYDEKS